VAVLVKMSDRPSAARERTIAEVAKAAFEFFSR
jgi:hypothetical protein